MGTRLRLSIKTVKSTVWSRGELRLHIEDAFRAYYSVGFGGFATVHAFAPVTFTGRR